MDPTKSSVNRSQQFQDDMLSHEQGHYNITALVSRDFFVDDVAENAELRLPHTSAAAVKAIRRSRSAEFNLIVDPAGMPVAPRISTLTKADS